MTGGATRRTAVGVALLTASLGLGIAACSRGSVPMPADSATPDQVVRAYADAVHAGDCETAGALVADSSQSWCGNVDITALEVTERTQEPKATESGDGPIIERVWVTLTTSGGDGSLADGEQMWSYLLDHTGPNGAWRIYDQGMG